MFPQLPDFKWKFSRPALAPAFRAKYSSANAQALGRKAKTESGTTALIERREARKAKVTPVATSAE